MDAGESVYDRGGREDRADTVAGWTLSLSRLWAPVRIHSQ